MKGYFVHTNKMRNAGHELGGLGFKCPQMLIRPLSWAYLAFIIRVFICNFRNKNTKVKSKPLVKLVSC